MLAWWVVCPADSFNGTDAGFGPTSILFSVIISTPGQYHVAGADLREFSSALHQGFGS